METTTFSVLPSIIAPVDALGPISSDLEDVERVLSRSLKNRYPAVARVVDHVRHFRGKRLRPVLLLLSAKACGRVVPAHHVLAAVVEMIHTATLVHDDILDNATVRRRVATVNALWGVQTGVLLGDYLFTHAFHLASTIDATACRLIGEATDRVCEGELCQVLQRGNLDLSETDYFDIIDGKTAALTACCCRLGALYAGANSEAVEALTAFGRLVGQAFQIADDVLDLVGDEKTTGKSLGTDLEQGKLTLPLIHFFNTADPELVQQGREALLGEDVNRREILRPLLVEAGSLAYAEEKAFELAERARDMLRVLPMSASRAILEAMADRVVRRDC